ncbi:MAG: S8 family serine peptidase [Pyrinomonadaceae bacterium]
MQVPSFARRLARTAPTRRFTLLLSLLLVAALLVPFATHGAGGGQDDAAPRKPSGAAKSREPVAEFAPGHVLVRFRSEAAALRAEALPSVGRAGVLDGVSSEIAARVERFEGSDLVRGLRIAYVEPGETLAAIEAFKSSADVLYAEPDYLRHITAAPNDPRFPEMYGLQKINAPTAWNTTTGSPGIVVGVIDEGVDITHPDLAANIWSNPGEVVNGVDDDGNGKIDDVNGWDFSTCTTGGTAGCGNNTVWDGGGGAIYPTDETDSHGTHVSGTIGAVGNNGVGVVGVNWNVRVMPLKFISATSAASSNAIRAMAYAKAMRDKFVNTGGAQGANVRVLNNSYGGGGSSQAELDSIRAVGNSGILFVVAAGNESTNNDFIPTFPSNYDSPNLIAVASSNSSDNLSSFSNIGARLVSVAAPGSAILSTTPDNTYSLFSGTSMATPHVSGLAALVCALNPNIDVLRLRSLIAYNGDVIAAAADKVYTRRRINAANSIAAFLENDTTAPAAVSNLQKSAQTGRAVTLTFTAPADNGNDGNSGRAALYEVSFLTGTGTTYVLKTAVPNPAGTQESINVNVPLRNTSGTLRVKAIDNAGNTSQADVSVTVDSLSADPYTTTETAASGLDTLGTPQSFHADDDYFNVALPAGFSFPFFGQSATSVVVSSNGTLYFQPLSTLPPANPDNDQFADSGSSTAQLEGFRMIAGLWDDLRTDCTTSGSGSPCDVYVNTSDPNKVIFRWEARVFNSTPDAGASVQFEIELNRDGTIRTRYGAGNTGIRPVVGIGAGEQGGSYVITSHTYPNVTSLTNAATVTFTPRTAVVPAASLQFGAASFTFSETAGAAVLTVARTGDASSAVTVEVRTIDSTAIVPCADTSGSVAFARCDYATTVQTVSFAAGDSATKTVNVPLVNDAHAEPNEVVQVALFNATGGATLGTPATVNLTITSDDAPNAANPILSSDFSFFVRQQYLDFFGREPDAGGFAAWKATLDNCPDPFNSNPSAPSATCDRVSVSKNFFLSAEFEQKGRFVFNFYKAAFSRLPLYAEIIPDMASLTAVDEAVFFARKAAFTNSFVQRQEFRNFYDALSNTAFVDALMNRYSLQQITTPDPLNPDGSTKITMTRAEMVGRLNLGTLTRAQALRAVADSDEVKAAEANPSFVAMQYFGYLRRDPEPGGYGDWLRTINANPSDIRSMVNGFLNSDEYKLRFGKL